MRGIKLSCALGFVAITVPLFTAGCSDHLKQAKAPVVHASNTPGLAGLDADIADRVRRSRYPGAVFVIARGDRIIHSAAIGVSDVEQGTPMRVDSIFRIMSMTKPVTAVAAMMLVEAGKLDLDTPVSSYLPELKDFDRAGAIPLTLRHLLTHTGGLKFLKFADEDDTTLAERIRGIAEDGLPNNPGERFRYSGYEGFDIVARVVESVSGLRYDQYLKDRIFDPLGMKDTTYVLSLEQKGRLVGLHKARWGKVTKDTPGFITAETHYPAGGAGLYSTASDYSRFAQMLAGGGTAGSVRLLKKETVAQMSRENLPAGYPGLPDQWAWGLGMRLVSVATQQLSPLPVGSYGWSGHYGTHFWVEPQNQLSAVFLVNLTNAGGAGSEDAFDFERLVADACKHDSRCVGKADGG